MTFKDKQKALKLFFKKIDNGQNIYLHRRAWYYLFSHLIVFLGKKGNLASAKKSHTAKIVVLYRTETTVKFCLFESVIGGGVSHSKPMFINKTIKDSQDFYILENQQGKPALKGKDVIYSPNITLTTKQCNVFINAQNKLIGKEYSPFRLLGRTYVLRLIKCMQKKIMKFFNVDITTTTKFKAGYTEKQIQDFIYNKPSFFCSELNKAVDVLIDITSLVEYKKNPYPDPMEYGRQDAKKGNLIKLQ
jgi:hypothetical protein